MNLSFKNYKEDKYLPKFQEGGNIPPEQVPAETGSEQVPAQDPMEQLIQAATRALQTQDCQTAMAVCQALVQAAGRDTCFGSVGHPLLFHTLPKGYRRKLHLDGHFQTGDW